MSNGWKRPPVEVGDTVSFWKYRNTAPCALVVTDIDDMTIGGMVFKGGGWKWVDCIFHVADPELETRPQMQEAMWDHTSRTKAILAGLEKLGVSEQAFVVPAVFTDPNQVAAIVEENKELDKVRQMMYAGCTDKGQLCRETGVHHKRVEKELNAFLAKKRALANS